MRLMIQPLTEGTAIGPAPAYAADYDAGAQAGTAVSMQYQTMGYSVGELEHGMVLPVFETVTNYRFDAFYHPYVGRFIEQLNRYGTDGFLAPTPEQDDSGLAHQLKTEAYFETTYDPTERVDRQHDPVDEIDFERGPYSLYNWELFFHAPTLVAAQLTRNRKFQEAQEWLHYVFNPTVPTGAVPERFWNIKPFHRNPGGRSIQELLSLLTRDDLDAEEQQAREALEQQIEEWEDRPFEPHVIARLREVAYQRAVVMQYLDNLIEGGDELFRRGSIEDLTEAEQEQMQQEATPGYIVSMGSAVLATLLLWRLFDWATNMPAAYDDWLKGLVLGFTAWLGFYVGPSLTSEFFEDKRWGAWAIGAGYWGVLAMAYGVYVGLFH
jgi:predicted DNA-binding protein